MSRIGKLPVVLPGNVKANLSGQLLKVEGPKGKLDLTLHPRMKVKVENNEVSVQRSSNVNTDRALHGLTRSLIQNMVIGVTDGYSKQLELEGVGYKAAMKGNVLNLLVGFTHPIDYQVPESVEVTCKGVTTILVSGTDKQKVGQVAAEIRNFQKPEPYKGKGIRYSDEHIRRKQGKKVG